MATNNSVNTEITANADGLQIKGGIVARILKWLGADITLTGAGTATITFPSVTSTLFSTGAAEISALTSKATPVDGDYLMIEDSAASDAKKKCTVAQLETAMGWADPAFDQSYLQFAMQYITSVTVGYVVDTSFMWNFYRAPTAGNANDGDEYLFQFMLDAGTYTLYTYGATSLNCGKVDHYLDGSGTAFATAQDWYTLSAATPSLKSIASVTISSKGRHTIKVKVNGKNASSGDYIFACTAMWFVPSTYTTA